MQLKGGAPLPFGYSTRLHVNAAACSSGPVWDLMWVDYKWVYMTLEEKETDSGRQSDN